MHTASSSLISTARAATCAVCSVLLFGCAPPATVVRPEASAPAAPITSPPPLATVTVAPATPPSASREFRAAWVSTVANIDWPSRAGLPVAQQKAEIDSILDRARSMNLNAIILQVRPSADAIYPSALEPWSEYLSGQQGKPPTPFYDPLKAWIDGAHARGIELHAWFNPYRARLSSNRTTLARDHVALRNPEIVKTYGKSLWMDPGEPAAAQQTLDVMLDVVKRYDIDGVHIDDYFYPYPIPLDAAAVDNGLSLTPNRPEVEFPDETSWNRYRNSGGTLTRPDWRRANVNALIERIYTGVHAEKPWVKVGISPFGLPRPDRRPPGIVGFSQYDKLYADAELWLNKGWLDYFTPQLYWPAAAAGQSFPVLLDYWITQNTQGRALWPGLYTSRIADKTARAFPAEEILTQIASMRARSDKVGGHAHFSIAALKGDREGIASALEANQYATPALIPAMPWLDAVPPAQPQVSLSSVGDALRVSLAPGPGKPLARYALWTRCGSEWRFSVQPADAIAVTVGGDARCLRPSAVAVAGVDRYGNESAAVWQALK
jgi:uncharacterized lipoprotein YddW (UPF0748 family)